MPRLSPLNASIAISPDSTWSLLSQDELVSLTGTKQPARQRRWLEARGWPYEDAYGRGSYPRVARFVFAEKMTGRDSCRKKPQPRYDALDRLGGIA